MIVRGWKATVNGCARLIVTVTGKYMPVIVAEGVPGYVVGEGWHKGEALRTPLSAQSPSGVDCNRSDLWKGQKTAVG